MAISGISAQLSITPDNSLLFVPDSPTASLFLRFFYYSILIR